MGSYHSRQIADLVLLLSELTFFSKYDTTGLFIFCRYIEDGFMLTDNHTTNHITHLHISHPNSSHLHHQQPFHLLARPHNFTQLSHYHISQNSPSCLPKTTSQIHVSTFLIKSSTTYFHRHHQN